MKKHPHVVRNVLMMVLCVAAAIVSMYGAVLLLDALVDIRAYQTAALAAVTSAALASEAGSSVLAAMQLMLVGMVRPCGKWLSRIQHVVLFLLRLYVAAVQLMLVVLSAVSIVRRLETAYAVLFTVLMTGIALTGYAGAVCLGNRLLREASEA